MKKEQRYQMDQALRQKLANHRSPVPEDMWSRIQAGRQKNRIHPFGWYYFSASVLLVGVIAGWLSFGKGSTPIPESDIQTLESIGQSIASTGEQSDQVTVQPDDANMLIEETAGRHTGSQFDVDRPSTDQERGATSRSISFRSSAQDNASSSSMATGSLEQNPSSSLIAASPTSSRDGVYSGKSNTTDQRTQGRMTVGQAGTRSSSVNDLAGFQGSKSRVDEVDYRFATTDLLPERTDDVTSLNPMTIPGAHLRNRKKGNPSCYSFNSFLRGVSVDAYFAPEYASRQLVYKDPGMIGYAEQRNEDESYVFAYSAGFRANAHFKGGLALRTGLIYTDIVERLRYRDENAQVTKVIDVTLDTIYQNGNIVYVWDTLSVTEYGSYHKVGYNRYRFYDIPLMLGYEIDRDRWVIQLNTGILFNVAASQRGDFLDPDHQLVNFDSNDDQAYRAFRTRVGSSLMMSLGFNYALRPKLHLIMEPQLRVWMQPLNIQSYPIDQKYVNLGLAMGIRNYF